MGRHQKVGLNRFDPAKGRFNAYRNDPNDPRSLSSDKVLSMFEDRAGIVWLGTDAGLNRFDPKTERVTIYRHDPRNSRSLSHDTVYAIREDRQGQLWVGTHFGLNHFDRRLGRLLRLQRNTACRMILSRQFWKTDRGISGWPHITASAGFIRPQEPFAIIQKRMACRAKSSAHMRQRAAGKVRTVRWFWDQ